MQLVASEDLLAELSSVLARQRLARFINPADAERVRQIMLQAAVFIDPGAPPHVCRDENDDYLLALARASHADYLVTRDADLLVMQRHGVTEIIYPARFLQVLTAPRRD